MFDIFFISYRESNCDKNWLHLKNRWPGAKRIHDVAGIYSAYERAARASSTEFFFTIDGDNLVLDDFRFSTEGLELDDETVYVWRCENPINQLIYGYGAIKLFPKKAFVQNPSSGIDITTSVAKKYKIVDQLASRTMFFETPLEAWRGAFRECAKLRSGVIKNQKDEESKKRLDRWLSSDGPVENIEWVRRGAKDGVDYAESEESLELLNDFERLSQRFLEFYNVE